LQTAARVKGIGAKDAYRFALWQRDRANPQIRSGGFDAKEDKSLHPRSYEQGVSVIHIRLLDFDNGFDFDGVVEIARDLSDGFRRIARMTFAALVQYEDVHD
jgi:hypothetical protein